jgi:hypothetical protein
METAGEVATVKDLVKGLVDDENYCVYTSCIEDHPRLCMIT